ncbi:hypothetical protein CWB63_18700, partial [Pseudoalteromonas sp. S409]
IFIIYSALFAASTAILKLILALLNKETAYVTSANEAAIKNRDTSKSVAIENRNMLNTIIIIGLIKL